MILSLLSVVKLVTNNQVYFYCICTPFLSTKYYCCKPHHKHTSDFSTCLMKIAIKKGCRALDVILPTKNVHRYLRL